MPGRRGTRSSLVAQALAAAAVVVLVAGSIYTVIGKATLARERGAELAAVTKDLYGYRQFYSSWKEAPDRGYYYRRYYFKRNQDDREYASHYVIFDPNRPNFLYYFNPKTQAFWGRYPLKREGAPRYSVLPKDKRKPRLDALRTELGLPEGSLLPFSATERLGVDQVWDTLLEALWPASP